MFERLSWLKRLQIALAVALVTFTIVLGVLVVRTALGKDPSLGTAAQVQQRSAKQSTSSTSSPSSAASGSSSSDDSTTSSGDSSGSYYDPYSYDDGSGQSSDGSSTGTYDNGSSSGTYNGGSSGTSSQVAPMTTQQS
jgi:cytoskeletal protein RodZ